VLALANVEGHIIVARKNYAIGNGYVFIGYYTVYGSVFAYCGFLKEN
jgi:hypothetical protein